MAKEFKRSSSKDSKDKPTSGPRSPRPASGKGKDSKKDKKPAFERFRDESRPSDFGASEPKRSSGGAYGDKKRKPFGDKPAFRKKREDDDREDNSRDEKPAFKKERSEFPAKRKSFGDKPAFRKKSSGSFRDKDEKPAYKKSGNDDFYESKPSFVRESDKKDFDYEAEYQTKKKGGTVKREEEKAPERKPFDKRGSSYSKPYKKTFTKRVGKGPSGNMHESANDGTVRLNKYIANAGICSRREADDLIASGVVQVNGKIITEMGYKVKPTDVIKYGGQTLKKERLVYLILNKPKDYITTLDDTHQRRTVQELIVGACRERVYPVGRLDRATTGLLMFTNDGELTKKLTHPRYGVRKIYHVELDKPLKRADMDQIEAGIELEDGDIKVDEISYVGEGKDKSIVGVEIHSGKNRIVRRIFEHFGYNVRKLDRVMFGPLTKKDMPRGRWRLLTEAEVGMLKMISAK